MSLPVPGPRIHREREEKKEEYEMLKSEMIQILMKHIHLYNIQTTQIIDILKKKKKLISIVFKFQIYTDQP